MIGLAALCLATALAIALSLLIAARALGWRRRRIAQLVRPWLLAIWIVLTIGLSLEAMDGLARTSRLAWVLLTCWLVTSLLVHLVDRRRAQPSHVTRRWGERVAHVGIGIAVGGIILSSMFTTSALRLMAPGETVKFNAWTIQLHEVWPAAGKGWAGVAAELRASSGSGVILLEPQLRSLADRSALSEPATISSGSGLLTASIGPRDGEGRWPIRLGWIPLLVLIPAGGMIAALGGALAMVGPPIARRRRLRRARLATAWWA